MAPVDIDVEVTAGAKLGDVHDFAYHLARSEGLEFPQLLDYEVRPSTRTNAMDIVFDTWVLTFGDGAEA